MLPTRVLFNQFNNKTKKMGEWLAIVYDKPGSDRSQVRDQHLANVPASVQSGQVLAAGAILNKLPQEGGNLDFAGSVLTLTAESKEEALEILSKDIYAKAGVWDLNNTLIYPMLTAVRVAKDLK